MKRSESVVMSVTICPDEIFAIACWVMRMDFR